jgi:hypothetical protein
MVTQPQNMKTQIRLHLTKQFFQSKTKHRDKDIHGIQNNFHDYFRVKTIYFTSKKKIDTYSEQKEQKHH